MLPCCQLPTRFRPLPIQHHKPVVPYCLATALALLALATACAGKPESPPSSAWASVALQATSQHPLPSAPAPVAVEAPGPQCITGPWLEEQLRKFDDRYAGAAADIRAALDQTRASLKAAATSTDLKPITAGLANVNAELATLTTRVDGLASSLQARAGNLERTLADALAAGPAAPTPAPAADRLGDAFAAILATPRQTLPLRTWLETHPNDPKAPEALFQLGLAFLDSGYPSAGRHYFTRLIDGYGTSLQAAEAKALLDSAGKRMAKPTRKRRPEAPARASQTACDPRCRPAVAVPPQEMPSKPAPATSATDAPPPGGGRLIPSRTGLQPEAAGTTPPGKSPLSPAAGETK